MFDWVELIDCFVVYYGLNVEIVEGVGGCCVVLMVFVGCKLDCVVSVDFEGFVVFFLYEVDVIENEEKLVVWMVMLMGDDIWWYKGMYCCYFVFCVV